jgi:hypothetical protein
VIEGSTSVYEVFRCFQNAKELEPRLTHMVEEYILESSLQVTRSLYVLFTKVLLAKRKASAKKDLSLLGGPTSDYIGRNLSGGKQYESILSTGGTLLSLQQFLSGMETLKELSQKERTLGKAFMQNPV